MGAATQVLMMGESVWSGRGTGGMRYLHGSRRPELDLEHKSIGMFLATYIRLFVNTLPTLILEKDLRMNDLDVVSDAIARNPGV
jgi:hypothetical protein